MTGALDKVMNRKNFISIFFISSLLFAGALISFVPEAKSAKTVPDNPLSFADWRTDLKVEAMAKGISAETFDRAFAGVEPTRPMPNIFPNGSAVRALQRAGRKFRKMPIF